METDFFAHPILTGKETIRMMFGKEYRDLAAIGTVADVMPMTGENRAIVSRGLARESTLLPRIFNRPELVVIDIE